LLLYYLFEDWRRAPSSQTARKLLDIHFAQRLLAEWTVDAAYFRAAKQVQDDYNSLSAAEKDTKRPVLEAYILGLKLARNFLRREVTAGHVMDSARLWRNDGGQTWAHALELLDLATAGDENITVAVVHNAYNTRTGTVMALFGQRNLTAAQRSQVITDMHAAAMFMLHALHRAEAATSPDAALQRKRRRVLPDSSI
jgi:hypothetical protein